MILIHRVVVMIENDILMAEIVELIENNESKIINWDFILNKYGFADIFEENKGVMETREDGDWVNYRGYLLRIISECIDRDKSNLLFMMKFILNFYLDIFEEDYENYNWLEEVMNYQLDDNILGEKNSDIADLRAFISYATPDKEIATEVKQKLENFGIESFLAHEDIEVSEEWKIRIIDELYRADIFVPILSNEFKTSDWCSQEAGIAAFRDYHQNILIIPLSLDQTIPYGFINHRQGKPIRRYVPINLLINPLKNHFKELDVVSGIINELKFADNFRYAEKVMSLLEPHFEELDTRQIDDVLEFSINNYQIWNARLCKNKYLPKLIKVSQDDILDQEKLDKLLDLIQ